MNDTNKDNDTREACYTFGSEQTKWLQHMPIICILSIFCTFLAECEQTIWTTTPPNRILIEYLARS